MLPQPASTGPRSTTEPSTPCGCWPSMPSRRSATVAPRHGREPGARGLPALPEGDEAARRYQLDPRSVVLSCGHASLTLYIQLYLGELQSRARGPEDHRLRTRGSKTRHPEYGHAAGVKTTISGPLGQGIGNAVGMAMAARNGGSTTPTLPRASRCSTTTSTRCAPTATSRRSQREASAIAGVRRSAT